MIFNTAILSFFFTLFICIAIYYYYIYVDCIYKGKIEKRIDKTPHNWTEICPKVIYAFSNKHNIKFLHSSCDLDCSSNRSRLLLILFSIFLPDFRCRSCFFRLFNRSLCFASRKTEFLCMIFGNFCFFSRIIWTYFGCMKASKFPENMNHAVLPLSYIFIKNYIFFLFYIFTSL